MKKSVVIIAYNEDRYIEKCILSVINQTQRADEILLIAHNCTDKTIEIASRYKEVSIIVYNGPVGIIYARIKGISNVSGDIVLCIDGDSVAKNNWIEEMTKLLNLNNNILVGSFVKLKGTLLGPLFNFIKILRFKINKDLIHELRCVWGPSFAFWGRDYKIVESILRESISLSERINLSRNPDDYWLAKYMSFFGNVEITDKTCVVMNQKEKNCIEDFYRHLENYKNGRKMNNFFILCSLKNQVFI